MSEKLEFAQRVKRLRDEQGIGIHDAKRIIEREDTLAAIDAISSLEDVKAVLRRLV